METEKIMIVEDEAILALELKMILTQRGFTITSIASSGKKAILNADKDHPDLILMDISLNGAMNGIEAASIIRESADIPIIFLTAFAEQETIERAKMVMPFGYILKPYQERELSITIDNALYVAKVNKERKLMEKKLGKYRDNLEEMVEQRTVELLQEITEHKRTEKERKKLIKKLQVAVENIKTLSGLLPICCNCKKIRDDKGYWNQIESYLQEHSEAKFSHSICQECAKKYYPDFDVNDD
jgi:CheY-like chemotaxis protein